MSTRVVSLQSGLTRQSAPVVEPPSPGPMLEDALAILVMVRETVASINGQEDTLHDALNGSAERFERLAQVDDFQQVQKLLFEEVAALKRVTLERRAAWEQTLEAFGNRVSTLEAQVDHIRQEAAVDPLTNVANRRTFERTCREWLEPNRPGFVMAMIDVDNFKTINDVLGHGTGDRVLVTIARTLGRSVRTGDVVARLGGDEFVVLAADVTLKQSESRFAAIGRAVRDTCAELSQHGVTASISIGLAERSAGDTLESLQQRADAALYQAKRSGKGRVAARPSPFIRDLMKGRDTRKRS